MNWKEDRLLTPALSSFEEERENRGEISFRGFLSPLRGEGIATTLVGVIGHSQPRPLIVSGLSKISKLKPKGEA
jgi:hypothetical protein